METTARNVLVVDDDVAMREMVMSLLDDVGHKANEASNKSQALDCLASRPYDAVITDVKMPGGSGVELLEEIRAKHPSTPVILMTAFGSIQSAVDAMRAGAFDFVTKPFKREVLLSTLGRAFERRDEVDAIERNQRNVDLTRWLTKRVLRELQREETTPVLVNAIDKVVALTDQLQVDTEKGAGASEARSSFLDHAVDQKMSLNALADLYTMKVLEHTGGNKARAAKILGINRRTLYRRGFGAEISPSRRDRNGEAREFEASIGLQQGG
ncbi:MAG: response regulator [Myxococcota bacterium]|jgi:DNA-binding NtrC family response regulator|nr:response regulator [Myxococcota bacterium]